MKNKQIVFNKTSEYYSKENNQNISLDQQKKQEFKEKLMEKFNISEDHAEKILINFEKKIKNNSSKKSNLKSELKDNYLKDRSPENSLAQSNEANPNVRQENYDAKKREEHAKKIDSTNNGDVDDILTDIIPDYNQKLSIEVNHIDLTFEVSNEKIDTIKESFIRTLKRNKSKKFKIHALNDISFKIYKGEKVGIIGYNGAGKSTLLNVIMGVYPLDKGFVKTYGRISPLLSLGAGFDVNYSGRKNIFLNGAVLGYDKDFLESKLDEIIEFSELGEFIDIPIKNYSSGMISKLGFSIAVAVEPDILIIDEILSVGDVNFQKKSADKMRSLMDGGTTVLLVSHSISQIRSICDKAIWIDNGKLREIGEVNKVCDNYIKDSENASNEQVANIQFR